MTETKPKPVYLPRYILVCYSCRNTWVARGEFQTDDRAEVYHYHAELAESWERREETDNRQLCWALQQHSVRLQTVSSSQVFVMSLKERAKDRPDVWCHCIHCIHPDVHPSFKIYTLDTCKTKYVKIKQFEHLFEPAFIWMLRNVINKRSIMNLFIILMLIIDLSVISQVKLF